MANFVTRKVVLRTLPKWVVSSFVTIFRMFCLDCKFKAKEKG